MAVDGIRLKGIVNAALSSSTFGFAPLFTLLLLAENFTPFEVLTYRWGVAALALAAFALFTGHSFRMKREQVFPFIMLGIFRAATSLSLVFAYRNIGGGAGSTIHFMYPLFVAIVMMTFFREKKSVVVLVALAASIFGAYLLSEEKAVSAGGDYAVGLACASVSVVTYGLYIIGVRKTSVYEMDSVALTCYVMAFGAVIFLLCSGISGEWVRIIPDSDWKLWLYVAGLALPATAISNMTLVYAVKQAGPTLTSALGALEPLTAVIMGVLVFGEPFTFRTLAGILLILAAVTTVVLKRR